MKFGRVFELKVEGEFGIIYTVRSPLTIDIDIYRSTFSDANTAKFTIFNLGSDVRRAVFKVRYETDIAHYRSLRLNAGYQQDPVLPLIFKGNIWQAYTQRRGPDWVTEIEGRDGLIGMINGQANITKPAGWNFKDLIQTIVGGMPKTTLNAVGNIVVPNTRGVTVTGNTWDAVQRLAGDDNYAFIDNEGVNVLAENDHIVIPGSVPLIDDAAGLLNTPRRNGAVVEVDLLFQPQMLIGQLVLLQSSSDGGANDGYYQVRGIRHRGRISGAFDGGVITSLSLWQGTQPIINHPVEQIVDEPGGVLV